MRFNRRSLSFAGLTLSVLALVFAACTDNPAGPGTPPVPPVVKPPTDPNGAMAIPCRADTRTRQVTCGVPGTSFGDARGAVIIGGQNKYVKLISSNVVVTDSAGGAEGDSIFAFDVRVQNIFRQPTDGRVQKMGTADGTNLDPSGIRVFFYSLVGNGGEAAVINEDDTGTFTTGNQEYFQYNQILNPGAISDPKQWKIYMGPGLTTFDFLLFVSTEVPIPEGWVDIWSDAAPVDTILVDSAGASVALVDTARGFAGQPQDTLDVTWTSLNPGIATVSPTGVVTTDPDTFGTATIRATTIVPGQYGDVVIVVSNKPAVTPASFDALENVTLTVSEAAGLKNNINDPDGDAQVEPDTIDTPHGRAIIAANGSFVYRGAAGYSGPDAFDFIVADGVSKDTGTVNITVQPSPYWFVDAGASAGDGRQDSPFNNYAAAKAAAEANDTILVFHSATALDGPVELENGQGLIGQGIAASLTRTLNGVPVTILAADSAPLITRTVPGAAVTLNANNHLAGLRITAAQGAAITGANFGTLTVARTWVNPRGPALLLSNGTLAGAGFGLLSSTESDSTGIELANVAGTLVADSGTVSSAAMTGIKIIGGTVSFSYPGNISSTGPGAAISGRTGGALVFSGNVTAPGGVRVTGNGAASVSFLGSVSSNAEGIVVSGGTAGTVLFGGPLTLSGKGIRARGNSGGTISFTDAATITTADSAGVDLTDNTGATLTFPNGGLSITVSGGAGAGFRATGGGLLALDSAGTTVTTATGTGLTLTGMNTGTTPVSFRSVSSTGAPSGIVLSGLTGTGGVAVHGGTITSPTSHGVHLTTLASVPVTLANLSISGAGAGGNAGISTSTVANLTVAGVAVTANGGPALSLETTTVNGSFSTLSSTGSTTSALILNTVDGAVLASAGTLSGATATTVAVVGGTLGFVYQGTVQQANNAALLSVVNHATGDLNFQGAVQATNGTGLQFTNASGNYFFSGATTLNGGDAGVDVLGGSTGAFIFAAGAQITNPSTGPALNVAASAPDSLVYAGSITHNAGRAVAVDGLSGGIMRITGAVAGSGAAATGIRVANNTGGIVEFTGTKTLSTGANSAVTLIGNAAAANIRFAGGPLAITTAGAVGFDADGGGTLAVTSTNGDNTVASTGAPAVRILNTAIHGASGVVFRSVTANGGVSGIVLQNTTTGTFGVTGTGAAGSGGTIQNTTGPAVSLTNTLAATLNRMNLSSGTGALNAAIRGSTFGTLTLTGTALTVGTGPALALSTGTLNGTAVNLGGTATGAVKGATFFDVGGSLEVSGGSLTAGLDSAVVVRAGTMSATWNGNITQANAFPLLAVVGHGQPGTLTFGGTLSATNGSGLQFNGADGDYTFNGTTTLNGGDAGIDVANGSDGKFTFASNTTVTGPTGGPALDVNGGTPAVVYQGALTHNTGRVVSVQNMSGDSVSITGNVTSGTAVTPNGTGILVQNNSGGAKVVFDGASKSLFTGGNAAVTLTNNTGATVRFGGGGLAITTTTGAGFSATGGGAVNVTGANNTVTSAGGAAVNIQNTDVGASGVVFRQVNANGGAAGIVLSSTGNTGGGFGVTGDGATAGSGGTIQNATQDGVRLSSARNVSLAFLNISGGSTSAGGNCGTLSASDCSAGVDMVNATSVTINRAIISNSAQMGISGQGVSGFTLTDSRVMSAGDGDNEFGLLFHELTGTALIEDVRVEGAEDTGMWLRNTAGTLNLTMNRDTFTENGINVGLNVGEHGSVFEIDGTAVANILVQGSEYFNLDRGAILAQAEGAPSTLNLTVQNNNLHDIGSFGVEALANYNSNLNVNVAGNTIHNWVTNGVNILGAVNSNVTARVTGNTLTNPRADDVANGIRVVQEEDSDMTTLVQNNTVSGQSFTGIIGFSRLGDLNTSAGTGSAYGTHHLTVRNNNISAPTAVNGGYGIDVQAQNEENEMCLDIGFSGSAGGNVSAGSGVGVTGIRVRKQNTDSGPGSNIVAFRIEGLATGAQSIATTQSFVATNNAPTTALASTSPSGGTFEGVATNSCRNAGTVTLPS